MARSADSNRNKRIPKSQVRLLGSLKPNLGKSIIILNSEIKRNQFNNRIANYYKIIKEINKWS